MSLIKIMQHLSILPVYWEHIPFITMLGDKPVFMAHTLATLISRPQSARIVSVGTHEIFGVPVKPGNVRCFTLLYFGCWRTILMNRLQKTCLTDRGARVSTEVWWWSFWTHTANCNLHVNTCSHILSCLTFR